MISELIHTLIYRSGTGSPGRVKKITDALSHDNPLPDEIAEAMKTNREVFNLYMDEQRNLIRQHNAAVRKAAAPVCAVRSAAASVPSFWKRSLICCRTVQRVVGFPEPSESPK